MSILFELIYGLSILVSISIISGFLGHRGNKVSYSAVLQGLLFGSASVIGMLHPLAVAPGLNFDGRSVMISLSGLFFGPVAAIIAVAMALILRIQQGGVGEIMGILVIISSALIGTLFYAQTEKTDGVVTMRQLLFMGILVHVTMIVLMFTLPAGKAISTIKIIGLPILILYPLATVFIGQIISELNERRQIAAALRESQIELTSANEELNASMDDLVSVEEELRSQFEDLEINSELLRKSEHTFRKLFEGSSDAVLILEGNNIIDCNRAALELLGYHFKVGIIGKSIGEISPEIQPDGQSSVVRIANEIETTEKRGKSRFEWWHLKNDGTLFPVEVMLTAILLHGENVFHALLRDISERNKMQQQLEYLSYHDQLTGLYNRRFFEEELKRLDVKRNFPLSIVMADVNGLKLINDSFGHVVGDQLLKKVAEVMTKGCRSDEIIARLGGDEFVILLPRTDVHQTELILKRVQDLALKEKIGSVDISVSFGWETKNNEEENIEEIFKKAEEHMYKKKLFESPSMRGKTLKAIINALYEKDKREELHSHGVSELCESMGHALCLQEDEIQELKTIGLLHDIGKIAIEESILNKPGKLTDDEWEEIKRHSEIGYRLLNTVNDMSVMAGYVLCHHEKWDGSGYPKGLKGADIPLQSRIIAVADTYDAMTSERSYRSALPETFALEELRKNAGLQFDPELVRIFIEKVLGTRIK
ncbi:MAG TPA: HD domain-containing phosphohydrolase [Desulfosporosinus sp.]|nr:HD domain-containing phosphohydrolase [Desulfosporosinus sp.]